MSKNREIYSSTLDPEEIVKLEDLLMPQRNKHFNAMCVPEGIGLVYVRFGVRHIL